MEGVQNYRPYFLPFAFAALNFAHRSFDDFEIFALAAADITAVVRLDATNFLGACPHDEHAI